MEFKFVDQFITNIIHYAILPPNKLNGFLITFDHVNEFFRFNAK